MFTKRIWSTTFTQDNLNNRFAFPSTGLKMKAKVKKTKPKKMNFQIFHALLSIFKAYSVKTKKFLEAVDHFVKPFT